MEHLPAGLRPLHDEYDRVGAAAWSDAHLVAEVARVLSVPKQAPADSFVLHAPLELLARAVLLRHVRPEAREAARRRLVWLAASYQEAGDPAPGSRLEDRRPEELAADLVGALERGDLDDVDRLAASLAAVTTAAELARLLGGWVVTSLAAAAHGSILLNLLPRVAGDQPGLGALLRGPARELARNAGWKLRWFEEPGSEAAGGPLTDALLDVPFLGSPGSLFIYPVMHQAEESGLAAKLLDGFTDPAQDVTQVRRELSRVAAWSMLQEPPDHGPYGWTHCLTMPQGVLGLARHGAEPGVAIAVAATHVVGFRAAMGTRALDPGQVPPAPTVTDPIHALDAGRDEAAAAAWHASEHRVPDLVAALATRASLHHDAHLVKYTLACLDAAAVDPDHRQLYLAAAASLSAWWSEQPGDQFLAA